MTHSIDVRDAVMNKIKQVAVRYSSDAVKELVRSVQNLPSGAEEAARDLVINAVIYLAHTWLTKCKAEHTKSETDNR